MGFEIQTAHSVEEIGQAEWDALGDSRPFSSYDWYSYGERAMTGSTPFYVSVLDGGEPIARASFWLVRDEPMPVQSPVVRRSLQAFLRARPLLICRAPLADSSGLFLPEPPRRQPALQAILEAARDYARSVSASFLVCDYLSPQESALADWPDGWRPVRMDEPGTCLPITWDSFEAYKKSLSRSAWKDYRRETNQAARLNLTMTAEPRVAPLPDAVLPLIRSVEQKHSATPKPWARAMLENAARLPSIWVSACIDSSQEQKLVGCGLLLSDRGVYIATLLGLDYTYSYVYFHIFYRAIQSVIEQGGRMLRAGSGAYEFKQRLGFTIEENNHLNFAGQSRMLSFLGGYFSE